MDNRYLDKAMDIFSKLIIGEEVSTKINQDLYQEYNNNAQVYDILQTLLKKSNLSLYAYEDALFVSAGEKNRIFGFTNDELKKTIGLRLNKELFLAYYIIYQVMMLFYKSSLDMSYVEYVKVESVIEAVNLSLKGVLSTLHQKALTTTEENSFETIGALWEDLPLIANNEDASTLKAARGSKTGFVKLVFNFLISQGLFVENGDKYYAKNRFRALVENYYENYRGRLYEIVTATEVEDDAKY